jgi:hypothetical protein
MAPKDEGNNWTSPELLGYARRLQAYLPAMEHIADKLAKGLVGPLRSAKAGDDLLAECLADVRSVLSSEIAFIADAKRKILASDPPGSFPRKHLPDCPLVLALCSAIDEKSTLTATNATDHEWLGALGLESMLAVSIETPWGKRIIGVCNGSLDEEPYQRADGSILRTFLQMLSVGLSSGESRVAADRYFWARLQGDHRYLSRASEDHARARLKLARGGSADGDVRFDNAEPDDLLADYIDAELSQALRRPPAANDDQTWDCVDVRPTENGGLEVIVDLHDNHAKTEPLAPGMYKRTALAAARVVLLRDMLERIAPDAGQQARQGTAQAVESTTKAGVSMRATKPGGQPVSYSDLADRLVALADPPADFPRGALPSELQVDYLRTLWQRLHYMALAGSRKPDDGSACATHTRYEQIRVLTAQALRSYLEVQQASGGVRIDSDWLSAWLASNVLLSGGLAAHYNVRCAPDGSNSCSVSPAAYLTYIVHLSQHALYALHCMRHSRRHDDFGKRGTLPETRHLDQYRRPAFADVPADSSPNLSKSQLFVLAEYAYREIGIVRELHIFESLMQQLNYELLLYAASSYYRDHFFHVMDVCLLGELLLRSIPATTSSSLASVAQRQTVANQLARGPLDALLRNWYVAALCHDLGYVIERAEDLLAPVCKLGGKGLDEYGNAVNAGLKEGAAAIRGRLQQSGETPGQLPPSLGAVASERPTNHGVVGYLHLRHCLEAAGLCADPYGPALNAILWHDLQGIDSSERDSPLAVLLVLCDHLQEWGRPKFGSTVLARQVMESLRYSEPPEFERRIRVPWLLVDGLTPIRLGQPSLPNVQCERCGVPRSKCEKGCLHTKTGAGQCLTFRLQFEESRESDFEPALAWLEWCRDMQSLRSQFDRLPWDITIVMEHCPPKMFQHLPWGPLEMDLLQDYAERNAEAAYLCEWIDAARQKKQGIRYEGDRKTGKETFSIDLHALGTPLRRGRLADGYRKFAQWKWQRLRQQLVAQSLTWFPE